MRCTRCGLDFMVLNSLPSGGPVCNTCYETLKLSDTNEEIESNGRKWGSVGDPAGSEGHSDGGAKVTAPEISTAKPVNDILFGAIWCVGGIVVTTVTHEMAVQQGGGSYVIAWGAILFGGLQLLKGLFRYITQPS